MIEALAIAAIFAAPIVALARTTRPRPLTIRTTPTITSLPRDVAIPTVWRRNKKGNP